MAEIAFVLNCEKILPYTKIKSKRKKKATEILAALQEVDQTCDLGFSTVCRLVQKFTNGRSEASQKCSSGRPI